jgi:hypothetical protein
VRKSLDIRRLQREAVANDPSPTRAAVTRSRIPWNRVVADETVWAIAKADLLCSEETAAVIEAAKAWTKSFSSPPRADLDDPTDIALYAAVQSLGSSLESLTELDDGEPLTLIAP